MRCMYVRNSRSGSRDHFWMIYYFSFLLPLQSQFFRYFIRSNNGLGVSHCKKMFQKGVQLWQAEKPQIVFFLCVMRRVSVTKEGGILGMLFQTDEVKAHFFLLFLSSTTFFVVLYQLSIKGCSRRRRSHFYYILAEGVIVVVVRSSSK